MFGTWRWKQRLLVIDIKEYKETERGSTRRVAEFSLFGDNASYYPTKAPIIPRSIIEIMCTNQARHRSGAFGLQIMTTKKDKYDFSVNTKQEQDALINFFV